MYIQALVIVVLLGKLMKRVFFGQLRAAEVEVSLGLYFLFTRSTSYHVWHSFFKHLIDRSWYAITETCLAFTVFREDFSTKFVALFTVLLFLKAFHWLVEDRVDYVSFILNEYFCRAYVFIKSLNFFFLTDGKKPYYFLGVPL